MRRAVLCLISVLGGVMAVRHTPCACGQQVVSTAPATVSYRSTSLGAHVLGPYLSPSVPEGSLVNSPRLHELIRDGKMQLSLQDAVALAIENNLDIVVARYDPPIAQTDLLRAKAGGATRGVEGAFQSGALFSGAIGSSVGGGGGGAGGAFGGGSAIGFSGAGGFDPVAGFSFSWNQSTTPLGITIVQGVPVVTTHTSNYSVSVGQSLPTGTSFGINFFAARQSTTGVTSIFNPQIPTQMAVGFTQPLLNGFGRRVNERFIRIAGNEVRIADSKFREKLIATVAQVSTLYWDFVSFEENVEVARHSLSLAEKSLSENQKEVALGVLARIDAVQAASEVARRREDLIVAQARAHDQQEQLKTAISKQVDSELAAAEIVATDRLPEPKPDDIFALEAALRLAAKSRPEIEQADLNIRNQEITIKATRSGLLPSLNLFATYAPQGLSGNQGAGGRIVRAGFAESLSQTLHNTYPDYSLGVSLGIPLRNRAARADLARTLLEARQLETKLRQAKNQVEQDVRRAVVAVTEAKAEVEAAGEAVKLAGQMLDGEQEKFRLGQSDTFKVIQAQRDLATAEGAEVTAHSNYAKALVQFEQATGSILERNRIEISDATNPRLG